MGQAGRLGGGDGTRRRGRARPERRHEPRGERDAGVRDCVGSQAPALSEVDRRVLRDGLSSLNLPTHDTVLDGLQRYLEELQLWNRRTDLVRFSDPRELIVRHVLDSLAPAPVIAEALGTQGTELARAHACDVGSGAGLPGVPLALCMPFEKVFLLERSASRAAFLRTVCAVVERSGLSVIEGDLRRLSDAFDVLLVRALSPFDDTAIGALAPALKTGGVLAVYQGKMDTAHATARRLRAFFGSIEVMQVSVPYLEAERHLVVARHVTTSCSES